MTDSSDELYGDLSNKPLYAIISLTVINLCTFVVGFIGNVVTCIVIASNKSMRTTTNYYLFNLAISDLLLLIVGIPYEIYMVWCPYKYLAGQLGCYLHVWLLEMSIVVSNLTVTAFTVERYLAICHPFVAQIVSQISRTKKLIACIWFIAALSALGLVWQNQHLVWEDTAICIYVQDVLPYYLEILTLIFYVFPMSIIIILYVLIGITVVKSSKMQKVRGDAKQQTSGIDRGTKKILKMLVVVIIAFFICWTPFHVQRVYTINPYLLFFDEDSSNKFATFNTALYYISGILYFFSAAVNPIIYNTMSDKFRSAFKETLSKSRHNSRLFKISWFSTTSTTGNNIFGIAESAL